MAAIELTTTTNVTRTGILTALNAQGHLTWVASNSASVGSVNTSVFNTSGSWNSTNTSVFNTSGSWNSVFTHVNTTSGSKFTGTFYTLSSDNVTVATLTFSNGLLVSIAP